MLIRADLLSTVTVRRRLKLRMAGLESVQLMQGVREKANGKDSKKPYPEPTLVPLGEKPKV